MNRALIGLVAAGRGRWHFGIGDPNAVSWLIVVAYAVAATVSMIAFLTARKRERQLAMVDPRASRDQRSLKHLWMLTFVAMVALGINKQLDLQTLLLQTARDQAYRGGWYNNRRPYQVAFIVAVALLGMIATIGLALSLRRVLRRVLLAVAGLGVLVSFVVVRAASFHYVDKVLSLGGEFRVNWLLELSGIGLIVVSASYWLWTEHTATMRTQGDAIGSSSADGAPAGNESIVV